MKKLLAILCVLAMLCMLCVPAFAVEGVDTLAIVGTGIPGVADWSPDDAAGEMDKVQDGVFTKEVTLTAGSTMTFKFAANDNWDVNFGGATVVVGDAVAMYQGGDNMTVTVDKNTTLTFTVDVTGENATMLVEGDGVGEAPVVTYDAYYVAGQAGLVGQDWIVDGAQMIEISDGVYELSFGDVAPGEYQFKVTVGNWDVCYGGDGPDGNYVINVEETSIVTVQFDSSSSTISVAMEPAMPPVEDPTEPSEEVTLPAEDETTEPSEDVTLPAEDETTEPSEDVTLPAEDETTEPSEVATVPTGEEDTSAPSEDVTEPSENVTVPSEDVTVPSEDAGIVQSTITVHAKVPASWAEPGCWAWDEAAGKNAFDAWPGMAMTQDGEWYTIYIPDWCNFIIINANAGSTQTDNTAIEVGKDLWIVVAEDKTATVYYEEPSADDLPAETEPSDPAEGETTAPTTATIPTQSAEQLAQKEADRIAARNKTLIILAIILVVIIIIACIMSIPKKLV